MNALHSLLAWANCRKKHLVLTGITLCICGFILLNIVAYNQAYAMTHFVANGLRTEKPETLSFFRKIKVLVCGVNIPRPQAQATPTCLELGYREFTITGSNGIRLGACSCTPPDAKGLVILFHGYGGEKSAMLTEASIFQELGYSVLLVDFRGSGQSSESYTSVGYHEADDVAEIVKYARENLAHSRIILFGQSMGGAAVLRAIHDLGVQSDGIIVEAVFDSMLNTIKHRFALMGVPSFPSAQLLMFWGGRQVGFDAFSHNPVDYAPSVKCPALFLHGSEDKMVSLDEAKRVFDAVPAPKQYVEFPGAKHESYTTNFRDEWKSAVGVFLK